MSTKAWVAVVVVVLVVVAGGWWVYAQQGQGPSGTAGINGSPNQGNLGGVGTGTPQQPGDGTGVSQNLIVGVNAGAGSVPGYLSAYNGMTLYTYAKDTKGNSVCTGTCATNWPPYTVASAGEINRPAGLAGVIGTIMRADGTLQVTYNDMPLYFYAKDSKPGDTTGQAVGGVWFVAQP